MKEHTPLLTDILCKFPLLSFHSHAVKTLLINPDLELLQIRYHSFCKKGPFLLQIGR